MRSFSRSIVSGAVSIALLCAVGWSCSGQEATHSTPAPSSSEGAANSGLGGGEAAPGGSSATADASTDAAGSAPVSGSGGTGAASVTQAGRTSTPAGAETGNGGSAGVESAAGGSAGGSAMGGSAMGGSAMGGSAMAGGAMAGGATAGSAMAGSAMAGSAMGGTGAGGAPAQAGTGGSSAGTGGTPLDGDACIAVDVGAGDMHTCALAGDGTVYCWGRNDEGQVGNGASNRQATPFEVTAAGKDNVDLLVGHHVSCVKKTSGQVMCWGTFDDGPGWTNVRDPRTFDVFGDDFSQLIVDTSACAIRASDGSVACWGYEDSQATTIAGFGNDAVQIDLEFRTVCAVKTGGSVMCRTDNDSPRTLSGVSDAVNVGLRRDHDGLGEPEDVMVAGSDGRGYYAHNGGTLSPMNLGGERVVLYNAQHHLIGAISETGRVMLWHSAICGGFGDNYPPEDNGSTAGDRRNYTSDEPAVPNGFESGATREIALGHEHACVIREDEAAVYCWGRNVEGQIGNGTTARECEVGGGNNPGPDGNQMTPYHVSWCP